MKKQLLLLAKMGIKIPAPTNNPKKVKVWQKFIASLCMWRVSVCKAFMILSLDNDLSLQEEEKLMKLMNGWFSDNLLIHGKRKEINIIMYDNVLMHRKYIRNKKHIIVCKKSNRRSFAPLFLYVRKIRACFWTAFSVYLHHIFFRIKLNVRYDNNHRAIRDRMRWMCLCASWSGSSFWRSCRRRWRKMRRYCFPCQ